MTGLKLSLLPLGTRVVYYRPKSRDHLEEGKVVFNHPEYKGSNCIEWDDGTVCGPGSRALRYVRVTSRPKVEKVTVRTSELQALMREMLDVGRRGYITRFMGTNGGVEKRYSVYDMGAAICSLLPKEVTTIKIYKLAGCKK